jgi:hypothetical protein
MVTVTVVVGLCASASATGRAAAFAAETNKPAVKTVENFIVFVLYFFVCLRGQKIRNFSSVESLFVQWYFGKY